MTASAGSSPQILVVDDTPTNVDVLLKVLEGEGFRVLVARDGASALEQARYSPPCLILLDVLMPGMDGFETCRELKASPATAAIPVIFMTALSDLKDKVRGFAAGGVDYVVKPLQHEEVVARVRMHLALRELQQRLEEANRNLDQKVRERTAELERALHELQILRNRLQSENQYLRAEISEAGYLHEMIGASPAWQRVLADVEVVACTDAAVLIRGETGTGKELIARALHERSIRRDRPMVKLNCAAISAGLVESELFGHTKGAFTGASERRMGRFQVADGGTLFLDEVSELTLDTQTKLLRVLQEGEFEPVGSSKTMHIDVRIIAATNRDLETDIAEGRFRADLFYRLNVFPILVPPLRSRPEDIPLLAQHFLERAARRQGRPVRSIDEAALAKFQNYAWPGNVRELQNTIERGVILSRGEVLRIEWDLRGVRQTPPDASAGADTPAVTAAKLSARGAPRNDELPTLEELERQHFIAALRKTGGVIEGPKGAARLLDLKPSTARFRMKKLGIRREHYLLNN